ncbi:MAG: LolA-related protein [Acetobacteraceae bacterium]
MVDRRSLLLALLLVPLPGAPAAPSLAATVMQLLAGLPSRSTRFVEEKHFASLTTPLVSRGVLIFRRPTYLEKDTYAPRQERLIINDNRLELIEQSEAPKVVRLNAHPVLHALVATLLAMLNGNLPALGRLYRIDEQGTIEAWRLMLVPIAAGLHKSVARVTIDGSEGTLRQIEIQQPNGDFDRLVLQ